MFQENRYLRGALTAVIALLALVGPFSQSQAQHPQMTPVLGAYFKMVFAGDVSDVDRAAGAATALCRLGGAAQVAQVGGARDALLAEGAGGGDVLALDVAGPKAHGLSYSL